MKMPALLAIRRGAPTWAPTTRAATQGRPYNYVSAGYPTAIFIRSGEPQDHENFVVRFSLAAALLRREIRGQ